MTLSITPYEPRHLEATASLWLESWRSNGVTLAREVPHAELAARIPVEMAAGWTALLGWQGEALVGFLALKQDVACLDQLFIAPEAQGRGIGAALLSLAKARMPEGMWLGTAAANTGARRFYERHGFRHTESDTHPTLGHAIVIYRWP